MISVSFRLLATTAVVALCASPSLAAVKHGNHSFSGGYKATWAMDANVGAAPSGPGGGAKGKSGGDDDDFDLDEELDDIDALDDIEEEVENDIDDLREDEDQNLGDDDDGDEDEEDEVDGDDDAAEIAAKNARRAAKNAAKVNGDSDERVQNNFALKHAYDFGKDTGLGKDTGFAWKSAFSYGFNNQEDRHDLDRTNWAINTGPEFKFKEWGLTVNPSLTYMDLNLDNNSQKQGVVASLGANWKVTKNFALTGRYNHEFTNNQKPKAANVDVDGVTVGAKYVWGKNLFSASYSPKFENNEQYGKDKNKWGMGLGYGRKLPWKMQADLGFKYGYADFEEVAVPGRCDESYAYTAKLSKDFAYGIYSEIGASIQSKDSSVNKNDNNGKTLYLSTGWKF